jgi:hypothetical protein
MTTDSRPSPNGTGRCRISVDPLDRIRIDPLFSTRAIRFRRGAIHSEIELVDVILGKEERLAE